MSNPPEPSNSPKRNRAQAAYLPIGITFIALGTVMSPSQGWAMALPFLAVGVTFLILSLEARAKKSGD